MNRLKGFLLHTGVICSFVCIAAKVLDWYNPYMDFAGHIWFTQLVLYLAVILLVFLKNPQKELLLLKESGRRTVRTGEQNIKTEKISGDNTGSGAKKADKDKMKELAKKKKELEEELDELKGNTVKGKALCALAFLLSIGLLLGLFVGMIKLDVGGFASEVLAPVIADVPVLRNILPADLQKKTAAELATEQAAAEAEAEAEAEAQMEADAAEAQAEADMAAEAEAKAEADAAETEAQAEADAAETEAQTEADAAETEAQTKADAVAEAEAQAEAQEEVDAEAAALQDYVDTYSAMKPQDAAKLFESMIPDKEDVVIDILQNLTPDERAVILSNMSVTNAADLTEKMRQ